VLHLHLGGQARSLEGGRRREDEPPGNADTSALIQEDNKHQGNKRRTRPCSQVCSQEPGLWQTSDGLEVVQSMAG
jgi:hypothetical protein